MADVIDYTKVLLEHRLKLTQKGQARVLVCMGSESDWPTMVFVCVVLNMFGIKFHVRILSAHRTPDRLREAMLAVEHDDYHIVIAGAGMAAHLAGMSAAWTWRPVLGVPIPGSTDVAQEAARDSTLMMPKGIPVATLAPGSHGAYNAGFLAVAILALADPQLDQKLKEFREKQTADIPEEPEWGTEKLKEVS